jgi:uncharacterized protein
MEILLIIIAAFGASVLTFFSGFGLGTILTPIFTIFLSLPLAIAMTGIVHLFNNLLKVFLVGKNADLSIAKSFGIPAIIAAIIGSYLMLRFSSIDPIMTYDLYGMNCNVTWIKIIVAIVLFSFSMIELLPYFQELKIDKKYLPFGGAFSGFFGGLTGNQGALRAAFLINSGMTKDAFIGTTCVVSTLVDLTRLGIYYNQVISSNILEQRTYLLAGILAAGAGALIGNKLIKKVTLASVQKMVGFMLIILSVLIGIGLL